MPLYTFTNTDADGDLSNTDNWDVAGSPAGAVPGSSDTALLDGQTISTGVLAAAVTSASGATVNAGTFSNDFSASGVTINGGTYGGAVDLGAGSTLNADPGVAYSVLGATFASGTFASPFTDNGGCTYQAGCIFNVTFILGAGSTINGGTFNNFITTVASTTYPYVLDGSFAIGCTFTETFIEGGTFPDSTLFDRCNISGGAFGTTNTGCTVTGVSAISGGAWTQLIVNDDVVFTGSPTFSTQLYIQFVRGPYTFSASIANVTLTVPDPAYPPQDKVLTGTPVGNIGDGSGPLFTGTLNIAASRMGSGLIRRK